MGGIIVEAGGNEKMEIWPGSIVRISYKIIRQTTDYQLTTNPLSPIFSATFSPLPGLRHGFCDRGKE
jgi:hypothetical protein